MISSILRSLRPQSERLAPELAGGLPLVGHVHEFSRRPVDMLRRGRERHGDAFRIRLVNKDVTVLSGPKAHQAFFHAPEDVLSAKECYKFTVPVFGRGVAYDVEPEVMDQQLAWIHPALSEKRLRTYANVMLDEVETYLDRWGDSGQVDLFKVTQELTTYIATRCLLGEEVRRHLTEDFARLYHDLDGGMSVLAFFAPYAPIPAFRRLDQARAEVVRLLSGVMAKRRREAKGNHEDFLQTLMDARYADGSAPPDDVIAGVLLTLIFAGQHTSAVLGAWTGLLLHQHPRFLGPVLAEFDRVFGSGAPVSVESLRQCTTLERAIKEAERMYPPLIMLMRNVVKDMTYGSHVLPAGSLAMVSPAMAHRIADVFPNPNMYDPDRYGPGREEDKRSLYTLIGFGGGKHRCMGMVFAYQQIKVIWATMLRRFEMELAGADYSPNYATLVVGPRQPCTVRYRRRKKPRSVVSTNGAAHTGATT